MPISDLQRRALQLSRDLKAIPANLARVAKATSAEASRWAFEQWALRTRAKAKFERADEMLFTRPALEMATHHRVAEWRASRFPIGVEVQDLTCGIGGDLIALAQRGPASGFDVDEAVLAMARHNLDRYGLSVQLALSDALTTPLKDYAFGDPARRSGSARTLDPSAFQPDPTILAKRFADIRLGAIKVSPMLPDSFLEQLGTELTLVSHGGECCEAVVWCGREATPGRRAVHIESGEAIDAAPLYAHSEEPLAFFYEADPAAIRANALGSIPGEGLHRLADSNGYLTSYAPPNPTVWLKTYRVEWHGPCRPDKITQALRERKAKVTAVKKRGVPIEPQDLKIKPQGENQLVLALYPLGRKIRAVLLTPLENPNSSRHS